MKVAVVHSFYRSSSPSGENQAVTAQVDMLRRLGIEVQLVSVSSDDVVWGATRSLTTALRVMTRRGIDPQRILQTFDPDIVHVHNLFPHFGYSWLTEWSGPLVATLHNFRPVCANGLLMRNGSFCDLCPNSHPLSAIRFGCYHDSRVRSIPLGLRNRNGVFGDPLLARADYLLMLSSEAKDLYCSFGVEARKSIVLPNGFHVPKPQSHQMGAGLAPPIFVGRLSEEKGIRRLIKHWPSKVPLDIVGDGPLREEIGHAMTSNVRLLGKLSHAAVLNKLQNAPFLVFPSECLEMLPTVVIEALGCGTPVLARAGNSSASLVLHHEVGAVYEDHNLITKVTELMAHRGELRWKCREVYEREYSDIVWGDRISSLYAELLDQAF